MKISKTSFYFPVISLVIAGAALAVYFLFFNSRDVYFMVIEGPPLLQKGDPVMIGQGKSGEVSKVIVSDKGEESHVVGFTMNGGLSIPSNSDIRAVHSTEGGENYISISVVASKDYFRPGDTVASGMPVMQAEENVPSGDVKGNISEQKPVYKIQLMASSHKIDLESEKFKGMGNVEEILVEGTYKYYTEGVNSFKAAKKLRDEVRKKGIGDAFIVPFLGGERISIQEARTFEK